jgi:hypothetical protein
MNKIFYLFLFSMSIIFSTNCKREANNKIIEEPHVNAFPKKVTIYQIDTITNTDILLYTINLYKNDSKNNLDSFNASNLYFAPLITRVYNDFNGTYGFNIDTFSFPEVGIYYNPNGNLINLKIGVNSCDGYLPGDDYTIKYNVDGSMDFYERRVYLARCGDYEDTARFVYLNDTIIFNSEYWFEKTTDKFIYYNDNLHVSTIPLFYHARNYFVQGRGGNFFNSGVTEFFKFGSKNMPLIKKAIIYDGVTVVDYSYLFNANNDVSQLTMNVTSLFDFLNKRIKYKFEY